MAACGTRHVSYVGDQDPDDDEYVYQFWETFQGANRRYGQKDYDFSIPSSVSGHVWECDSSQCRRGTWLFLENSVHEGINYTTPVLYRCSVGWNDKWEVKTLHNCYETWGNQTKPKSGWEKVATPEGPWAAQRYPGAKFYEEIFNHKLCVLTADKLSQKQKTATVSDCDRYVTCYKKQHAKKCYKKSNTNRTTCTEAIVECDSGYKLADPFSGWTASEGEPLYGNCVKQSSGTTTPISAKKTTASTSVSVEKTTKSTSASAKKTAKSTSTSAKKTTKSTSASAKKTAKSTSTSAKKTTASTSAQSAVAHKTVVKQVVSSNSSTGGKQACEGSGGTWSKEECTCSDGVHLTQSTDKMTCECAIGYERNAQKVCVPTDETKCNQVAGAQWADGECKCVNPGYELKDGKDGKECVKGAELVSLEQKESRTNITSVYEKLNAMSGDFKVSVWKNADGNFNTARLASDSIAAVVLGTTGALVTSNIVKKNQVSGGFEDINCQVGGQTVAGWGDQFNVGIQ